MIPWGLMLTAELTIIIFVYIYLHIWDDSYIIRCSNYTVQPICYLARFVFLLISRPSSILRCNRYELIWYFTLGLRPISTGLAQQAQNLNTSFINVLGQARPRPIRAWYRPAPPKVTSVLGSAVACMEEMKYKKVCKCVSGVRELL
jgi:hypothetical protein